MDKKTIMLIKTNNKSYSIPRRRLTKIWIHNIEIRWFDDSLIFIMEILIPGETVFLLKRRPSSWFCAHNIADLSTGVEHITLVNERHGAMASYITDNYCLSRKKWCYYKYKRHKCKNSISKFFFNLQINYRLNLFYNPDKNDIDTRHQTQHGEIVLKPETLIRSLSVAWINPGMDK